MRKVLAIVCFVCFLLVLQPGQVFAQQKAVSLNQAITESAKYLFEHLPEGSTVAVYGFSTPDNTKVENGINLLSEHIVEELTTLFSRERPRFTTVNRQRMEIVTNELNLHLSGDISEETAKSIGKATGADFVITGSVRRVGREYRLTISPITVEENEVFPSAAAIIREDDTQLNSFLIHADKKNYWFSLGGRAGVASHFFTLSKDATGEVDNPSIAFEPTIHAALHFNKFFAVQTELALSVDKVSYSGIEASSGAKSGAYNASFESYSLRMPLLARFTYANPEKLGGFSFGVLAGIGFNIPLGAMQTQSNLYGDGSYRFSMPVGYVAGANVGFSFGEGRRHTVFSDIRFSGDFAKTAIHDNSGTLALYDRNTLSFSLGYEFTIRE